MGYIENTLAADEQVIYRAKFHWLYTAAAIVALLVLGLVVGIGIIIFLFLMIDKWTTEIAITNKRLVYKRGWISRKTDEISLRKLEEINLEQSILGRIFGYGKIKVHGTGIGSINLPAIDNPLKFRKEIENTKENFADTLL
jgi:uncharacterized membrane protein YdbT with pleckstrin-like domain